MIYIEKFNLLDSNEEHRIGIEASPTRLDNTNYPLNIFPPMDLEEIKFSDITIIYGGNGSGKSTLLNIIASKLNANRVNSINKGYYFNEYVNRSSVEMGLNSPYEIKAIMSDDVFDSLLDIRAINLGLNREKEFLTQEYLRNKFDTSEVAFDDLERLKAVSASRSKSVNKYVRSRLSNINLQEHSNGESALFFWEREIKEDSIYILDEPENSLSAENQLKLKQFIEESVRFYNCQFIISTHSPFLLSLMDAKIYDLDSRPCVTRRWTELPNVKLYYDFFNERKDEFEEDK